MIARKNRAVWTASGVVRLGAFVICVLGLLALVPAAASAAFLDANCPGPPNDQFTTSGQSRTAQTFTAQRTGTLVKGQFEINKLGSPGADWVMQVLAVDGSGTPTNNVLASTAVPDGTVPDGFSTLVAAFGSPAPVVAGQQYALSLNRPGATTYGMQDRDDDPCPGQEFFATTQTGPFAPLPFDLVFATYVDPPNDFSIGKLKRRKLTLTVPGPGTIVVVDASQPTGTTASAAATKKKRLKTSSATAAAPGTVTVTLRLTKAAKQLLKAKGKVKAKAGVTFTPTGGTAKTIGAKLKIK